MLRNLNRVALGASLLASFGADAFTIEAMKHDIQGITASNFDGIIGKFRESSVSSLWFYKDDNKADKALLDEYNSVASELKGMSKVCAINCNEYAVFCKNNNVKETPAVMIYPPNPIPAFLYEGKIEAKALIGKITKFMPDLSVRLKDKPELDQFLTTDPSKPKVLLFSSKKTVPTMFKALSSETVFKRTMKFGFVTEQDEEIVKRFNVKKFPTIITVRGSQSEVKETYKGEMKFVPIKDWVNLHSESGMGDKVHGGGKKSEESIEEAKPWLVQEVPELTLKSHQDICFKGEGLCVIYLKDGDLSAQEENMLTALSKRFTSQLSDRGAKMKWMWMNLALEKEYKALFAPGALPSAVVFNPHKRLRFALLEGEGTESAIVSLVDKVLGGDARFKMVPGQKLPGWAIREQKAAGKGKPEL